jgi:hypothetical protein
LQPTSAVEERVVEASEHAWERAVAEVEAWLPSLDVRADVGQSGTSTARLLEVPAATLEQLDAARWLDFTVTHSDMAHDRFRLVPQGAGGVEIETALTRGHTDVTPRTSRPFTTAAALDGGQTMVTNQTDAHVAGSMARFTDALSTAYRAAVAINTYLSHGPASPGFGRHWDDHEVIVIQAIGAKYWELHQPTMIGPARPYTGDDEAGKVAWSGVLEPGQALTIPRGWAHLATGLEGETSFHLTVSMVRQSTVDALARCLRTDTCPFDVPTLDTIGDADAAALLDYGMASFRAELPIDSTNGPIDALLADHADFEGWNLRLQMPGGVVFVRDPDATPEGGVVVAGGQEQVALSAAGAEVLISLLEREQCSLDEVVDASGVDRTDAVASLRALARAELLGVSRTRP